MKKIQLKYGDKTIYEVLEEASDSIGETIYKIIEDNKEKWVQGEYYKIIEKSFK